MEKNMFHKLDADKININWNKNPIPMEKFLSFLMVETEISRDHLGYGNGWTRRVNKEINLTIRGGIVNGINYLDAIEYGSRMQSKYHNYVNPFYLFEIMTDEGKKFFLEYYSVEINSEVNCINESIKNTKEELVKLKNDLKEVKNIIDIYKNSFN